MSHQPIDFRPGVVLIKLELSESVFCGDKDWLCHWPSGVPTRTTPSFGFFFVENFEIIFSFNLEVKVIFCIFEIFWVFVFSLETYIGSIKIDWKHANEIRNKKRGLDTMRSETQWAVTKQLLEILFPFYRKYVSNLRVMFPKSNNCFETMLLVSNRISVVSMYNFCFQSHVSNVLISFLIVIVSNVCFQNRIQFRNNFSLFKKKVFFKCFLND